MDDGDTSLTAQVIIFILSTIITAVIVVSAFRMRGAKPKYFAAVEFWVYLPHEEMPKQEAIMTSMISQNPHARPGFAPIGAKEGMVFSDIRLHVTQVLRRKNPHSFRPDLFEGDVDVSKETLAGLADAQCFVKVRYISEVPLSDSRHLTFMLHIADAYARLGNACAVYDAVSEVLLSPAEFAARISEHADTTRPELHVRVLWESNEGPGTAKTKGMVKAGLDELQTAAADSDMRQLVTEVLKEAAYAMWRVGDTKGRVVVEYFGDQFEVTPTPKRGGGSELQIVRVQAR